MNNETVALEVNLGEGMQTQMNVSEIDAKIITSLLAEFKKCDQITPSIYQDILDSDINAEAKQLLLSLRLFQDYKIKCFAQMSLSIH